MGRTPTPDWLPEWSKGSDSSSDVFVRVGSNPTPVIFYLFLYYETYVRYFVVNNTTFYCIYHLLLHYYPYLYIHSNTFLLFLLIYQTAYIIQYYLGIFFIFSSTLLYFDALLPHFHLFQKWVIKYRNWSYFYYNADREWIFVFKIENNSLIYYGGMTNLVLVIYLIICNDF